MQNKLFELISGTIGVYPTPTQITAWFNNIIAGVPILSSFTTTIISTLTNTIYYTFQQSIPYYQEINVFNGKIIGILNRKINTLTAWNLIQQRLQLYLSSITSKITGSETIGTVKTQATTQNQDINDSALSSNTFNPLNANDLNVDIPKLDASNNQNVSLTNNSANANLASNNQVSTASTTANDNETITRSKYDLSIINSFVAQSDILLTKIMFIISKSFEIIQYTDSNKNSLNIWT